ncbi:MAG TPA: 2-oxo acid dehydrogenase subunit E2 [Bacteroidales bacterium]|nr:2-oxo acid dehydrogenase subunit E2 [Bacteroidales bacterium]HPT11207.1 2-oxo acid dehydrogenase subunit E2 [Bacteroidales bacterium]
METHYNIQSIPRSRIATFDVFAVGMERHHVSALLEFDVTGRRNQLQGMRRGGVNISFNGWLIKTIADVLYQHREAAAYRSGKKRLILFDDINISVIIEKQIGNSRVPIPLVIIKANEKSAEQITREIEKARQSDFSENDIVLDKKSSSLERLYYHLPGFLRRSVWRYLLRHPHQTYSKMGNVAITSVGVAGRINGWFIHRSVHPVSFGVGSVLKKPFICGDEIKIREILNMTILIDHDVIDGAQMVRLLNDLTREVENGV